MSNILDKAWQNLYGLGITQTEDLQNELPSANEGTPPITPRHPYSQFFAIPSGDADGLTPEPVPIPSIAGSGAGVSNLEALGATYRRAWRSPIATDRDQHPGMLISPYPQFATTITFSTNQVKRIQIPKTAKLMTIGSGASVGNIANVVIVSKSEFTLPLPAALPEYLEDRVDPIVLGNGLQLGIVWHPCEGLGALWAGTPSSGLIVTLGFWCGYGPIINFAEPCPQMCESPLMQEGKGFDK